jgi:hypothetical protein
VHEHILAAAALRLDKSVPFGRVNHFTVPLATLRLPFPTPPPTPDATPSPARKKPLARSLIVSGQHARSISHLICGG